MTPSLQELESALIAADKAGDTDAARAIAGDIDRLRSQPASPRMAAARTRPTSPIGYADRVSEVTGYPVLPDSDLTAGERGMLGLSDTFEEKRAEFMKMYPIGTFNQVKLPGDRTETVYSKGPTHPARLVDEPGATAMDIMDRPQVIPELMTQGALALKFPGLGPWGWAGSAGLQALVPGATHLIKEGVQELRGAQQEPIGDVLKTAGMESLVDLIAGGAGAGGQRLISKISGGPKHPTPQGIIEDYQDIQAMQQLDPGALPDPAAYQMRPDLLIMNRLAAQAGSTSPAMKSFAAKQEQTFSDLIGEMQTIQMGKYGAKLATTGGRAMDRAKKDITRSFYVSPEEAGKAIKGVFTDTFNKKSRAEINAAYQKAGELAEGVRFDMTRAQQVANEITGSVDANATRMIDPELVNLEGFPLTQTAVQEFVNVAATPHAKIARVSALLKKIDPEQTNWEVVKELRSQLGDAFKDLPAEDATSGQAKYLWGALTDVMENPIGGNKPFVDAWKKANTLASKRFEVFDQGKVLKILGEDSPSAIAETFGQNPHMMTPIVRDVIGKYAPEKKTMIRNSVQGYIVGQPNAVEAMTKWESRNPQAFNFLFPNAKLKADFRKAAEAMDQLKNTDIQRMLDANVPRHERGRQLLSNTGPSELEQTIRMLGGRKSEGVAAMRLATMDDLIQKAVTTREGKPFLDSKALSGAIQDAKQRGVWEKVLSKEDKIRIKGLDAYLRRVFKSMSDTGTSLEQAQAIAALKHPSTFLQGFHALAINNRVLAPIMMSPKTAYLFRPDKRVGRGKRRVSTPGNWAFLGNLAGEFSRIRTEESLRQ